MLAVAANFFHFLSIFLPISRPKHRTHGPLAATDPVGNLFVYVGHDCRPHFTYTTYEYESYNYVYIYVYIYLYVLLISLLSRFFALPFVLTYCTPAAEVNHTLYMYTFCVGETEVSCKLYCPSLYTYIYTYTNMYTNCIRPTLVRRRYVVLLRFTVYIYVY